MLELHEVSKSFGSLTVVDKVSLRLEPGERRVVLGPNGAGKTTLFNLIAGIVTPSAGEILIAGRRATDLSVEARARLGLSRSYQKNNLFDALTVRDNLALAAAAARGLSSCLTRDTHGDGDIVAAVKDAAGQVGIGDVLDAPVSALSYGFRRQLEVGIALARQPTVLLMDEPTSGVGPGMIRAVHTLLKRLPRSLAVLIIEHDMDLAFDVADRITVLNHGQVVFEGTPAETRASPLVNAIYLGGPTP